MTAISLQTSALRSRAREYLRLCKPRVVTLIVFTAMVGMALASPGLPAMATFAVASLGIALAAGGAAAFNCLVERHIDARMTRTRLRPLPVGRVGAAEALLVAAVLAGTGLGLLHRYVNPLTCWLTFATFVGYSVIYTVLLKPATPQNIVIGGASGAMPPLLGWTAMTGQIGHEAVLLFLIIFAWTPPHFWSLALYRRDDYARAGLPMLPVTHGVQYTCLHILFYTLLLAAVTLLPVVTGMCGAAYALVALWLNGVFVVHAWGLCRDYSDTRARRAFRWSIVYLGVLFAALLLDHWIP
jgi:protoheme IX farnesyltransferase